MIETSGGFSFTFESFQSVARIGVIRHDAFERDDTPRVPLASAIDDAHTAAADFLQNLIIADPPMGVLHFVFGQDRFE